MPPRMGVRPSASKPDASGDIPDLVVNVPPQMHRAQQPDAATVEGLDAMRRREVLYFISFGSGSSGNSQYIGSRTEGVLVDVGVEPDTIEAAMRDAGLSMSAVKGILLTHDHSDHVRFVYTLLRRYRHLTVYCTPKTMTGMLRRHSISRRIKDYHTPIYKEFPFTVGEAEITAFDTSHDGTDNAGFFISRGANTFAVATDLGTVTDRVDYYLHKARYVMLESNYDALMLATGPYAAYLKARIAGPTGHLDNRDAAAMAVKLATAGTMTHLFLCHLSQENNTPAKALAEVRNALAEAGITEVGEASGSLDDDRCALQLVALPRTEPSPLYILRAP